MKQKQIVLTTLSVLFFLTTSAFIFTWIKTDQKERWLNEAAWKEEKNKVRTLLVLGANPNRRTPGSAPALHGAAFNGNVELIELLLENGAEVDVEGKFGITPLWLAQENNHSEAEKVLIANGANLDTSHISPP